MLSNNVSVTLSPASSSMYIRGLIPRTFAELAEAIPIDAGSCRVTVSDVAEKVGGNSTQYLS